MRKTACWRGNELNLCLVDFKVNKTDRMYMDKAYNDFPVYHKGK